MVRGNARRAEEDRDPGGADRDRGCHDHRGWRDSGRIGASDACIPQGHTYPYSHTYTHGLSHAQGVSDAQGQRIVNGHGPDDRQAHTHAKGNPAANPRAYRVTESRGYRVAVARRKRAAYRVTLTDAGSPAQRLAVAHRNRISPRVAIT